MTTPAPAQTLTKPTQRSADGAPRKHRLIVLRHGELRWNHENKFCGWIDIPLSDKGEQEARHAGELLTEKNIKPTVMYTLLLQRSIKLGHLILEAMGRLWVPHHKTWRLNERHYGAFQGRDKTEVYTEYGKEKYQYYRRNYAAVPPLAEAPSTDERYAGIEDLPCGELLQLVMQRLIPFVKREIVERDVLAGGHTVLVVTHGSIVRSLIKHFCHVSDDQISKINAPTGVPLVFDLDDSGELVGEYYYLDEELAQKRMAKVAMEGHPKI